MNSEDKIREREREREIEIHTYIKNIIYKCFSHRVEKVNEV